MVSRKWALWAGLVVLAAGVLGTMYLRRDTGIPVQVVKAARQRVQAKVNASGHVQAVLKVDISANVMGKITRLAVKEGDRVKAGQFLLEIDPALSKAIVEGAEASFKALGHDLEVSRVRGNQARRDFERAKSNLRAGIISQAEYDALGTALAAAEMAELGAKRRVDQARAAVQQSRVGLHQTLLTSPMDGVVTARRIERGETVVIGVQNQPGTVLLTVSDMSKVEAEMEVDEASIPAVKLGQGAEVRIDAYPGHVYRGEVTEVGGSPLLRANANEAIKFKVKVWIKNPPLTIKPGLSAQADIFTGASENAVAVPIQALATRELKLEKGAVPAQGSSRDEEGVFVVEARRCRFVPVRTGLMGELNMEIVEGLKGGEQVITGPFSALRELKGGERVRPEEPRTTTEGKD